MVSTGLATGALVLAALSCGARARGERIVLITIETLRYDSFAGPPGGPSSMPSTLALSREAAVFLRSYASTSSTQPTHATLFTGLHPWQHGVTRNGQVLDDSFTTVAEILRDAGFSTAAVVSSVPVASRFGFAQGFGSFEESFTHGGRSREWEGVALDSDRFYSLADTTTEAALRSLDRAEGDRQFFWFHYFDPHAPYGDTTDERPIHPTSVLRYAAAGETDVADVVRLCRDLYARDVSSLDRSLQPLFTRLAAARVTFETSILVVADHGESLGEGGSMGHGGRLSEEQLHVPLFILSPRIVSGPREDLVGSIDIAPTLLSLAGIADELPGGRDLTKPSPAVNRLFGMRRTFSGPAGELRLDGREYPYEPYLFYGIDPVGRLLTGNASRIAEGLPPGTPAEDEERRQISLLFRTFQSHAEGHGTAEDVVDPDTLRALRALGYVQ